MSTVQSTATQLSLSKQFEKCRPLFRWAGGKRRLLRQILPLLPLKYNDYYEPFCGGAALFFELQPQAATLGDKNEELINCYRKVKENPEDVIKALEQFKSTKADYNKIREYVPSDSTERAARLIYLIGHSFNGLYRVNSEGGYNVPYGTRRKTKFDPQRIRDVSKAFSNVEFVHGDFETAVMEAQQGDLVYFDPPYTVAHGNNGFIQYNEKIFSWSDQERLAKLAENLATRGCHVIVSNAAHSSIAKIYADFKIKIVSRHSGIGGSAESRKFIAEYLFTK